ncbi:DUF1003 domain-containing protein [Pseudoroseomonas wenyumeiae]|uniref:DUF1003 domain-containing protein n=1 Tax=Teichococcus wenyumeiae TaxID=2478470 RepID=A0A3A9JS83_9PROT|nr:DUF1003 domain-containing protein [Pseudoroseomonas wenyumeiae]RKK03558.1 DUF1003 domain-containing protein [Pseudoroseomonas wenyumeiae]RMI25740.1 DUF1003 domain-containing protein [Pseudoroseomonas wenyumeiae]
MKSTDQSVTLLAQQLLDNGFERFTPRERRVLLQIAKRHPVTRNVNHAVADADSLGDRIADKVARFGGSWTFINLFVGTMAAWVLANTVILTRYGTPFDAYPFIFLNLVLSMIAALQAPLIMMSQNRQAERDRMTASLDYEVNLKAEIEIMALHEKLDALRFDQLERKLDIMLDRLASRS